MRILPVIFTFFLSCSSSNNRKLSYWETQKDSFIYKNKIEFVSDSTLHADYKKCKIFRHSLFTKVVGSDPVYLYSWQQRDSSKNEFTIIDDDGELGLKIFYFILDKQDSLLSWKQIAGKGSEAGYWFETRSKFISRDTILNIAAITQWLDFETTKKAAKPKGDTTFSYFNINLSGQFEQRIYKEVKDLNFKDE